MEKIKLVNESILEVVDVDIADDAMTIVSTSQIADLRAVFDNPYNLTTIEVLTETDVICGIYNGYKKAISYVINPGEIESIVVTLVKPNETEERIARLEDALKTMIKSELGVL